MTNHKRDEQVHRDEHNDVALAKRTLGVGYNYDDKEYGVFGIGPDGSAQVEDKRSVDINDRLKEIELVLKKLLVHAEIITDTFINQEDLR